MSSSKRSSDNGQIQNKIDHHSELDSLFVSIMSEILQDVIDSSTEVADTVLELSSKLLLDKGKISSADFYGLYSGDVDMDSLTDIIKQQVDAIRDKTLSTAQTSSEALHPVGNNISQVQKHLESMVMLDKSIRAKVTPLICSMQFSELLHKHLRNIVTAWQMIVAYEGTEGEIALDVLKKDIENILRTQAERDMFEKLVLGKEKVS